MYTKERRFNLDDRRRSIDDEIPACHEEQGEIICEERRQVPDRRINNIHVEWTDDTEDV
ncbi:MAG: hypothetical protein PVF08_07590 [Gammaproteobacteria bacterium]|jgi:hypothetical protein